MEGSCDYGHFDIVLADFLKEKGISKNQLSEKANLQRTQLNSYCKNNKLPYIVSGPVQIRRDHQFHESCPPSCFCSPVYTISTQISTVSRRI